MRATDGARLAVRQRHHRVRTLALLAVPQLKLLGPQAERRANGRCAGGHNSFATAVPTDHAKKALQLQMASATECVHFH